MIINDQPGRLLAIIVIGPSLLWAGLSLNKSVRENNKAESLRLAKIINGPQTYQKIHKTISNIIDSNIKPKHLENYLKHAFRIYN
jgi:hypothetical protein